MTMAKEFRGNDIVNNKNNGVDVDKWDYFIRDSHACGFLNNFDKERALSVLRVRRYQKGTEKEANDRINLYNMFNLRIADVFKLADNSKILERKPNQTILIVEILSAQKSAEEKEL
ncbi:hypothetical protein KUTeg_014937 [Tegillarca granosa]|uniref:Uncharacterized protein n=1 Tax=Tegillarca granosa TaxID=220873 RepID=A0ABQ9EU75_TEGGR|nr:hypothetical protein KUTeg_014937 [Tegillarca granosa]